MKKTIPLTLALFLVFACKSNNSGDKTGEAGLAPAETAEISQNSIDPEIMENGKALYQTHCLACHQTDGSGNPGMYPPLQQTEFVLGDKIEMAKIVLNGKEGPVEVKGEMYNSVMASYNFLTDKEIADLLTYVRNSFGNEASAIEEEDVAKARAAE